MSGMKVWHVLVGVGAALGLGCESEDGHSAEATIAGTWVHEAAGERTVITLGSNELVISRGNTTFSAHEVGEGFEIDYQTGSQGPSAYRADQVYSGLDLGAMPLPLGGTTTVCSSDLATEYCTGVLNESMASAQCAGMRGIPAWIPNLNGVATARRTATAQTIFAQLGGTWTVNPSGGGSCEMVIEPASAEGDSSTSVELRCTGTGDEADGWIHLIFDGDYVSGTNSSGLDLAAVRQ